MQQGDVPRTFADIRKLIDDYGYSSNTDIKSGIQKFINWYKYNNLKKSFNKININLKF